MALPSTPVLDAFTRANETPLAAPWVDSTYWWGQGLDLVSNAVANSDLTGPVFAAGSYWTTAQYGPDFDAFFTVSALAPIDTGTFGMDLALSAADLDTGPSTLFEFIFTRVSGTTYTCEIAYYLNDVFQSFVISGFTLALTAGDRLGVRRVGTGWYVYQNGVVVGTGTSALHLVPLTFSLFINEQQATTTTRLDGFGGGTLTALTPPTTSGNPAVLGSPSSGRTSTFAAYTLAHTVASGTGALLIYVAQKSGFQLLPEVTYGGVDVPLLNAHQPIDRMPWTFLLLNPTAGAANIEVTPDPSEPFFDSIAVAAVNLANYGGVRFADWAYDLTAGTPAFTPLSKIHTEPTDLVLSCVAQTLAGATFAPVNQTTLVDQSGLGDSHIKIAVGQASLISEFTSINWTLADYHIFDVHVMAIKRLDPTPTGVPYAIGPVTNTLCVEDQPAPSAASPGPLGTIPLPGDWWHWWHTVPATHRTLVVLLAWADGSAPVTSVTFGGVPMVDYYSPGNSRAMFLLENAPVGTFLIEVQQGDRRRTFMAGAYSIASEGIIATNSQSSTFKSIDVTTTPEAIAIAMVDYAQFEPYATVNGGADAGSFLLWNQPIYFNSNIPEGNRPNINGTADCGLSVYTIATGSTATPSWTSSLSGIFTTQIVFSFSPSPPPPPPSGPTGCPDSLPLAPVTGTGCSSGLQSPAV